MARTSDDTMEGGDSEIIQTESVASPRRISPAPQNNSNDQPEGEQEYNDRFEKRREQFKKRAKTAVKKTGKVMTSSYTCAVCISISGAVTMICGIIMIVIGRGDDEVKQDKASRDFMLIGGSVFFVFGLAMILLAVIYTVVHYLRKRSKAAKDPFQIKQQEREARLKAAQEDGSIVTVVQTATPDSQIPVCSTEHEHDHVTEQRIKQTRRQSLFNTSSQSQADVTTINKPAPLKKTKSALQFIGFGKKEKLPPISDSTELQEVSSADQGASSGKGMKHSQSAVEIFSTSQTDTLPPLSGARRGSSFELDHYEGRPANHNKLGRAPALHTITDITDYDSEI